MRNRLRMRLRLHPKIKTEPKPRGNEPSSQQYYLQTPTLESCSEVMSGVVPAVLGGEVQAELQLAWLAARQVQQLHRSDCRGGQRVGTPANREGVQIHSTSVIEFNLTDSLPPPIIGCPILFLCNCNYWKVCLKKLAKISMMFNDNYNRDLSVWKKKIGTKFQ